MRVGGCEGNVVFGWAVGVLAAEGRNAKGGRWLQFACIDWEATPLFKVDTIRMLEVSRDSIA